MKKIFEKIEGTIKENGSKLEKGIKESFVTSKKKVEELSKSASEQIGANLGKTANMAGKLADQTLKVSKEASSKTAEKISGLSETAAAKSKELFKNSFETKNKQEKKIP